MTVAVDTSFPLNLSVDQEIQAVEVREQKPLATRCIQDKVAENTCPLARLIATNRLFGSA